MKFAKRLEVDTARLAGFLGMAGEPVDEQAAGQLALAAQAVWQAAQPRWVWAGFARGGNGSLPGYLPGQAVRRHLRGCKCGVLFALTLGQPLEHWLRTAQASDVALAALGDAAANVLVEQYARQAEREVAAAAPAEQPVTGRFSPGYGDLPLAVQPQWLAVLDAQKAIGLTTSRAGVLLPTKSITAMVGFAAEKANKPEELSAAAGCGQCNQRQDCAQYTEGGHCAKRYI